MIALLALSALLAVVAAEPPAVTGVYFVAPPPPPPSPPRVDLEKVTEDVMAQLKQLDGADSGSYHVYLPDGRLQQVTYTTAPLPADAVSSAEQLSQYRHHRPAPQPAPFNFQNTQQLNNQVVTGFNQQSSQSNQKGRLVSSEQPQPANYVASVSYTDVQPITGPIYTHSDQPLTRILRYAPTFV